MKKFLNLSTLLGQPRVLCSYFTVLITIARSNLTLTNRLFFVLVCLHTDRWIIRQERRGKRDIEKIKIIANQNGRLI